MLHEGQQVELAVEKAASGGWMLARHLGQVVLVRGAIPGERVAAWIERAEKRLAYAVTRDVIEPSPDRVPVQDDPMCGGLLFAHIAYPRQLALKSDILRDAFARLGHVPIDQAIDVAGSRTDNYRMRARLHVRGGRVGFYREGTHQLCDAAATRQLSAETIAAAQRIALELERLAAGALTSISITESVAGDQRAAHLEIAAGARVSASALETAMGSAGVTGISAREADAFRNVIVGTPVVRDPLSTIVGSDEIVGSLQRHAESFFQGNRHLLSTLVAAVLDAVPRNQAVLDLYAGVGLFSVALAAAGHEADIDAVEGDRAAGEDLIQNAKPYARLHPVVAHVEDTVAGRQRSPAPTTIADPPRTGLSKQASDGLARYGSSRIVYVSCDPPTLARDARRLLDAGYRLTSIRAFDLFPNTPHVETLAIFDR
jgi:23S rRNA (uracil1939-C5)-methyltransferase